MSNDVEMNLMYADYLKSVVNSRIVDESIKSTFLGRIENSKADSELQNLVALDLEQYLIDNNLINE